MPVSGTRRADPFEKVFPMNFAQSPSTVRIAKRLTQATGYIELGMTVQAMESLDRAGVLAEAEGLDALQSLVEMLRGVAGRTTGRGDDVTAALAEAVELLPDSASQSAWLALTACYRHSGDADAAVNSLGRARGAHAA